MESLQQPRLLRVFALKDAQPSWAFKSVSHCRPTPSLAPTHPKLTYHSPPRPVGPSSQIRHVASPRAAPASPSAEDGRSAPSLTPSSRAHCPHPHDDRAPTTQSPHPASSLCHCRPIQRRQLDSVRLWGLCLSLSLPGKAPAPTVVAHSYYKIIVGFFR